MADTQNVLDMIQEHDVKYVDFRFTDPRGKWQHLAHHVRTITDDFLKLLEDSFSRDWRKPRTWPWTRLAWAYGFALVGVALAAGLNLLAASAGPVSKLSKPPTVHIDTTQRFRAAP